MKVFLSHSSRDKPAVEALACYLRQQGIDAWLDKWEIAPGDDIIAKINEGLEQADAGVIVFSAQSLQSPWVNAEVSSLTQARIEGAQLLIPVQVGDDAYIPPLLRPLCRLRIDDHAAIADALLHRRPPRPPFCGASAAAPAKGAPPGAPPSTPNCWPSARPWRTASSPCAMACKAGNSTRWRPWPTRYPDALADEVPAEELR